MTFDRFVVSAGTGAAIIAVSFTVLTVAGLLTGSHYVSFVFPDVRRAKSPFWYWLLTSSYAAIALIGWTIFARS